MPASHRFDAIGTRWQVDTVDPLPAGLVEQIAARVEAFDRTYSRFRDDSLVSAIARTPGSYPFPDDAGELFELYRRLYEATDAAVSPLVGRTLETMGYDRGYSLRALEQRAPVPRWEDSIAWHDGALTTLRPLVLDVGAAGKGYLVDIVGRLLVAAGLHEFVVDASGDIVHAGPAPIRVALEHPLDGTKAVGVVELANGSLCASASNRRAWGDGLHHIIDATTGLPADRVIATWAMAKTGLEADGLATALFLAEPARLAHTFDFDFVRMFATGRVERSPHLNGELFV
ncbi:FAD:protein FMN transferase [Conyzicola nivalis]|uniref:FAD:protein FMN transferase n=1 Tax=Conyzicola nivalis TaxID=1477021 RepID=UPI0016635008|nr:FAD:protein FMN transferase [Conyzicola nivalis]